MQQNMVRFINSIFVCGGYIILVIASTTDTPCYTESSSWYGTISRTRQNITCQRWDRQIPHSHSQSILGFPEGNLVQANNYCRDPDGEGAPWCYTMDENVRWDFCDVPACTDTGSDTSSIDPVSTSSPTAITNKTPTFTDGNFTTTETTSHGIAVNTTIGDTPFTTSIFNDSMLTSTISVAESTTGVISSTPATTVATTSQGNAISTCDMFLYVFVLAGNVNAELYM